MKKVSPPRQIVQIIARDVSWSHAREDRGHTRVRSDRLSTTCQVSSTLRGEVKFNPECADISFSTRGTDTKMLHKTIIKQ